MFLFRVIDLLALVGLFVQTFVAWIFVLVLASIGRSVASRPALRNFLWAFAALALSLTVLSVRFFRVHEVELNPELWRDGSLAPTICYALYMGLKTLFGLQLVQGSYRLAGRRVPRLLRRGQWVAAAILASTAIPFPGIGDLLPIQATVMLASSIASLRALRPLRGSDSAFRILRGSLIALGASWLVHGAATLVEPGSPIARILPFNSILDLGVQLALGVGLVVGLLQTAHERRLTAERERERLRRSIEKDEKLRALGTVVSGVAHELNNPLTVIAGYADMLRESGAAGRPAEIIAEQADRCRGIVQNLSALAGQSVHPRRELDLEELARRVVRGLDVDRDRVRIAPMDGLRISADRIGLEQVLANLVQNALHAAPPGEPVAIRARGVEGGVELEVADRGPGVPPGLRDRLFEPFFTTKAPGQGTGLGLSIAHAIVRDHGGTIGFETGPGGRGAVFRVCLPERPPDDETPAPREAAQARGQSLLIVDDDDAVRAVLGAQARRHGWSVRDAASAEEALGLALAEFDAVLCDLRMPGIGGVGLHDRLDAERPELLDRFVFLTGDLASSGSVEFAGRCRSPLLHKPVDFDELFARLDAAAAAARPGRLTIGA